MDIDGEWVFLFMENAKKCI